MSSAIAIHPEHPSGQRLAVLDVLRGVAILGILLVNVRSFGRFSSEYFNPKALGDPPPVDWFVWLLNHVVAERKFITILTLLFGAGIVLMAQKSTDTPAVFEQKFNRRMGWLLVFGLIHALLIWPGDILAAYALCALIAVRFRHRPPVELAILGIMLFAGAMVLWVVISGILVFLLPAETLALLAGRYWTPTTEVIAQEMGRLRYDWVVAAGERAVSALGAQLWMLASERIWRVLGMMLIGMALLKIGFLSGGWSLQHYRQTVRIGLIIGIPVTLSGLWFNEAVDWDFRYSFLLGRIANHWASIALALAWIALAIMLVKRGVMGRTCRALEAVGRLAMTNYIGQSLICASVFYSFGLGLFGRLGNLQLLGVVVTVWVIQIACSLLWLRHVGAGPFERLWRYLSR